MFGLIEFILYFVLYGIIFVFAITSAYLLFMFCHRKTSFTASDQIQRNFSNCNHIDHNDQDSSNLIHNRKPIDISNVKQLSSSSSTFATKTRVVVSKEVDSLLQKIIEDLIDQYIFVWYRPLVVNSMESDSNTASKSIDHFRLVLKTDIWLLLSSFIDRLYSVNYVNFVAISAVNRLLKHFQSLNKNSNLTKHSESPNAAFKTFDSDTVLEKRHRKNDSITTAISSTSLNSISSSSSNKSLSSSSTFATSQSHGGATNISSMSSIDSAGQNLLNFKLSLWKIPQSSDVDTVSGEKLNLIDDKIMPPSSSQFNPVGQSIFPLVSHLKSIELEKTLLSHLSTFLLDTLLKLSILEKRSPLIGTNLELVQSFLSEMCSYFLFQLIEYLSDPSFINCQIVKIIKKHFLVKDLIYSHDKSLNDDLIAQNTLSLNNWLERGTNHVIGQEEGIFCFNDVKLCIVKQNFNKLFELLDKCHDIDYLKYIRLIIIGEILDAAVISYLDKKSSGKHGRTQTKSSLKSKKAISTLDELGRNRTLIKLDRNGHHKQFNFNAQINNKVKHLQSKNVQRYLNQLRYAKTICEQKIQIEKRNSAALLSTSEGVDFSSSESTEHSIDSVDRSFDISLNSELVRSFHEHSFFGSVDDSVTNCLDGTLHQNLANYNRHGHKRESFITHPLLSNRFKAKSKRIFKFGVIMANEVSRGYLKNFLRHSLFNHDELRSSYNKFRKDTLIADCAVYLVEFWETVQLFFDYFVHHWKLTTQIRQSDPNSASKMSATFTSLFGSKIPESGDCSITMLHELYRKCYLLILQTVSDHRFHYTFSDRFLQLPNELLKQLEQFLLGDIELHALDCDVHDFNIDQYLRFTCDVQCQWLDRVDWEHFSRVFVLLEKLVYNCLNEEFYPQFLISAEYDEMLFNCTVVNGESSQSNVWINGQGDRNRLIQMNKVFPSARWNEFCSNRTNSSHNPIFRSSSIRSRHFRLKSSKPVPKVWVNRHQLIDIVKNRCILFNSLEFPLFACQCVQFVTRNRLAVKCCIRKILSNLQCQNSINEFGPMFSDIVQCLDEDIVQYEKICEYLYSMISNAFCWINSDFSCNVDNVYIRSDNNHLGNSEKSSNSNRLFPLMGFIFSSSSGSTSDLSTVGNDNCSEPSTDLHAPPAFTSKSKNYTSRMGFRVQISALLSRLKHPHHRLDEDIRLELCSKWTSSWSVTQTLDSLIQYFNRSILPLVHMTAYLSRYEPDRYLQVLYEREVGNEFNISKQVKYLENLPKTLNRNILEIKQLLRNELRERIKQRKLAKSNLNSVNGTGTSAGIANVARAVEVDHLTPKMMVSFKELLDKEEEEVEEAGDAFNIQFDSSHLSSGSGESSFCAIAGQGAVSSNLTNSKHLLDYFFNHLTADQNICKTTGFLNFIGKTIGPATTLTIENAKSCIRCLLHQNLFASNGDDLNSLVLHSLALVLEQSKVEINQLIAVDSRVEAESTSEENCEVQMSSSTLSNTAKMFQNAFNLSSFGGKLFTPSTLHTLKGANKSGQLMFLHARSLLSERTSSDLLDYLLSLFKLFDEGTNLCANCYLVTHNSSPASKLSRGGGSGWRRASTNAAVTRFRLFNIQHLPSQQNGPETVQSQSISTQLGSEGNPSVHSSRMDSTTSSFTSSRLADAALLFDDQFSIEQFGLLSADPSDADATNLIEPLFQLLVEVFELKGSAVTKTLRRTLVFAFRLFFGQTMLSKTIKHLLQSFFIDSNLIYCLSLVHSYLSQPENVQSSSSWSQLLSTGRNMSKMPTVAEEVEAEDEKEIFDDQCKEADEEKTEQKFDRYLDHLSQLLGSIKVDQELSSEEKLPTDKDQVTTDLGQGETSDTVPESDILDHETDVADPNEADRAQRLQLLAKQLLFASVPTFLNHLFGQENTATGLNKCFDVLQYQPLNKQLIYELIEAFLLEYFPEFKKI